jgi:hypothetical protein
MKLVLVGVVLAIVLFVLGLIWPRASHKVQRPFDEAARKAEGKGRAKAGKAGDVSAASLKTVRRAVDKSADAGRSIHNEVRDRVQSSR